MTEKQVYYRTRRQSKREIENYWKDFQGCKRILDLGCGVGSFGKYKPDGIEVYGVDSDPAAVNEAKQYENAKLLNVEKNKLPYENGFFDGVIAKDILEHVLRPAELVSEVKRVLKRNGVVLASVPCPGKKAWDDYTHVRAFTERAFRELFMDHGFTIEYLKRTRGFPGFGKLGLNVIVPYILKIPGLSLLTHGYMIKARKI